VRIHIVRSISFSGFCVPLAIFVEELLLHPQGKGFVSYASKLSNLAGKEKASNWSSSSF